jgi:hypothetical protein
MAISYIISLREVKIMAEQQSGRTAGFIVQRNQPLIGIISHEEGQDVIHYFAEEAEADAAISSSMIQEILNLAGSWSDLHWDVVEEEVYHIRHESSPTPLITL